MTTWKQFKDAVESQGIRDDTPIGDIIWTHACVPSVVLGGDGVPTAIVNGEELDDEEDFDIDDDDDDDEDWDDDYGDEEDADDSH